MDESRAPVTSGYFLRKRKGRKGKVDTSRYRKSVHVYKNTDDSAADDSKYSLPLRYLKIPKRGTDAQYYFLLSSLLLLATTITIVSSCGCLFYFMFKGMIFSHQ